VGVSVVGGRGAQIGESCAGGPAAPSGECCARSNFLRVSPPSENLPLRGSLHAGKGNPGAEDLWEEEFEAGLVHMLDRITKFVANGSDLGRD
jgi:hypothetical protein